MRTLAQRGIKEHVEKWAKQSTFYTCEGEEGEFADEPRSPVPQSPQITPASDEGAASAPPVPLSSEEATTANSAKPVELTAPASNVSDAPKPQKELTEQEKKAAEMKAKLAANQRARGKKKKKKKKK